ITRIGKYVSGSAAADSTIEYSVTFTASTPLIATSVEITIAAIITTWKRDAWRCWWYLPHGHPRYWATMYPADNDVSRAAPNVAAKMPTSTIARPSLPSTAATGRATWESWPTPMWRGASTRWAHVMIASESSPPSGNPISTLARFSLRSLIVQPSSTAPLEKKNTSYGVIAAPNRAMA